MSLFGPKKLSDILSTFNKTVSELRALADSNDAKITETNKQIEMLRNTEAILTEEAGRARNIAINIETSILKVPSNA